MTREELEKEAEEWVISNTEIYDDKFGIECEEEPQAKEAYIAGAEPREKRIAELEAQIEKMKSDVKGNIKWADENKNHQMYFKLNAMLNQWEIKENDL